jgi:hypothetical protein
MRVVLFDVCIVKGLVKFKMRTGHNIAIIVKVKERFFVRNAMGKKRCSVIHARDVK